MGISFSSGTPVALSNGKLFTDEGSASISDEDGNLLFYTDGSKVYNRNHQIMPNGEGLLGNTSSAQSAIIVPKPLDSNIYYIFTVGHQTSPHGIKLSVVDMRLDNGMGDLSNKNLSLETQTGDEESVAKEKITSIKGKECNTFWVITSNRNSFYSFKIDKDGVNFNGVRSEHDGEDKTPDEPLEDLKGHLKISPDGKTLVSANATSGTFLFDFNDENGKVTNRKLIIPTLMGINGYGVEFSRDSKKLYVSTGHHSQLDNATNIRPNPGTAKIYQFNLTLGNTSDIISSRKEIYSTNSGYRGALQLASNGKIYYARSRQASLGVINFPEKEADKVNFIENGLFLNGKTCTEGLPPFIQSYFLSIDINDSDTNEVINNQDEKYCIGQSKTLIPEEVTGTNISYKWEFKNTSGVTSIIHNQRVLNLNNLSSSDSGTYTLTIELIDECNNLKLFTGIFNVEVFESAIATPTKDILFCDALSPDGFNEFDLKVEKTDLILGGLNPSTFKVVYFLDEVDAQDNVIANALVNDKYINTVPFSTQTVYARVHNKNAPNNCFDITSFDIIITDLPNSQTPSDYILCDDTTSTGGNVDGVTSFKLSSRDNQILGNLIDYTVTYHSSKNGAENKTDIIDKDVLRSVTNTETVYVRVQNNNSPACFDASKELKLIVATIPTILNNPASIKECISTNNTNTTVNLTIAEPNISNNPGGTFEYYEDKAGTIKITNFTNYPIIVNTIKSVWVKTISVNGCSDNLTELKIEVSKTTNQGYNKIFAPVCDDYTGTPGSDTDFMTLFESQIFTEATNGISPSKDEQVFFYETQSDRTNSINAIDVNNYRNDITKINRTDIPGGVQFPIYYKLVNTTNNNCQGLGEFYFQINTVPKAKTPSNFELCDDFDSGQFNDGVNKGINLRDKISEIFAGTSQTEANFDVIFYKSESDVINGNNAIPLVETTNYKNDAPAGWVIGTVSTQTIYVRVQNKNSIGCYNNHVSFDININPLPTITTAIPDIEVCDIPTIGDPDSRNGLAQGIDLSLRDTDVLNGRLASEYKVSYHRTRAEATAGLVSTELNKTSYDNNPNFTTLTNGIGEETLFISLLNINSGCKAEVSTLKIIIYPEPNIPAIIDNFSTCDHDNNGLGNDTVGIVEDIALINKKEQVLANYPTTEHDNFKVTFHTSKALAESGANPIDENKYKNTQNNQIIYVRVEDTRTGCINDDLTFEIIVNPLPTFDEIDTPQIVCLNNLPLRIEIQNALTSYTYTWKDENGATLNTNPDDDFLDITKGGNYSVTATMKDGTGCERTREFRINESNIATITEADISIVDDSDNNSITIDTTNLGIGDYEFALFDKVTNTFIIDFQDEPFFDDLKGGIYSIYVRDKNGCDVNNVPVEIEVPVVEYPKFFTPNGDGKNDVWSIKGVNSFFFPGSTIYIFNRYGKVVGNISVNNNTWDGTYKGKPLPSDDYWFNIQLINKDGTARKPRKGHFSLLRTSN